MQVHVTDYYYIRISHYTILLIPEIHLRQIVKTCLSVWHKFRRFKWSRWGFDWRTLVMQPVGASMKKKTATHPLGGESSLASPGQSFQFKVKYYSLNCIMVSFPMKGGRVEEQRRAAPCKQDSITPLNLWPQTTHSHLWISSGLDVSVHVRIARSCVESMLCRNAMGGGSWPTKLPTKTCPATFETCRHSPVLSSSTITSVTGIRLCFWSNNIISVLQTLWNILQKRSLARFFESLFNHITYVVAYNIMEYEMWNSILRA